MTGEERGVRVDGAALLSSVLPSAARCAESTEDPATVQDSVSVLLPHASLARQREFATGRRCAHHALRQLGILQTDLPRKLNGAPVWPKGVVGSITHCGQYRAAAVAATEHITGLGIDAEICQPLPDGVFRRVCSIAQRRHVSMLARSCPETLWPVLAFSCKESAYKALQEQRVLTDGVRDLEVDFDPADHSFSARGDASGAPDLAGAWHVIDGLVLTCAWQIAEGTARKDWYVTPNNRV